MTGPWRDAFDRCPEHPSPLPGLPAPATDRRGRRVCSRRSIRHRTVVRHRCGHRPDGRSSVRLGRRSLPGRVPTAHAGHGTGSAFRSRQPPLARVHPGGGRRRRRRRVRLSTADRRRPVRSARALPCSRGRSWAGYDLADALVLADVGAGLVLDDFATSLAPTDSDPDPVFGQVEVPQATGMIAVQQGSSIPQALAALRAAAYAQNRPILDLARDVLARARSASGRHRTEHVVTSPEDPV